MKNFRFICLSIFLLSCFAGGAHAVLTDPLTTIELEKSVHFLAPDGSDLLVQAGTYAIEPAEEWIRLMSGERHDAVLIEATKASHGLELEEPMGLSVPGETKEESDLHHVTLLLPDGQSLDATGTYSGIRPRGFLKNTFKQLKKKTRQVYRKARSTTKKTVSKAKDSINKAKKHTQRTARKLSKPARNAALHAKRHVENSARLSLHERMMAVMKQSIEETNEDKRYFLEKMKNNNKMAQEIHQKLKNRRLAKQAKERLEQQLKDLEDVNQQLTFKLQKATQKLAQAHQTMSSIVKKMSDTRKSIVENLR